jgi:hypothetical protein
MVRRTGPLLGPVPAAELLQNEERGAEHEEAGTRAALPPEELPDWA